jgi:hypothetical protein
LDRCANAATLASQLRGPLGGAKFVVEPPEDDIEVVEAAETGLEPADRRRKLSRAPAAEMRADLGEMSEPSHLDAEPVEPRRGRSSAGLPVGRPDPGVSDRLLLLENAGEQLLGGPTWREFEALAQSLEQVRIALRVQEDAQQFASGPRIIA